MVYLAEMTRTTIRDFDLAEFERRLNLAGVNEEVFNILGDGEQNHLRF